MTKARAVSNGAAAKGDIVAGSGTNTSAVLGVGTDGYALVADSTQTTGLGYKNLVPSQTSNSGKYLTTDGTNTSWGTINAGAYTLIASGSLGATGVTLSSIPQTYTHLELRIIGAARTGVGTNSQLNMTFNAVTTTSYFWSLGSSSQAAFVNSTSGVNFAGFIFVDGNSTYRQSTIQILNYSNSTIKKVVNAYGDNTLSASSAAGAAGFGFGGLYSLTAVSSIELSGTSINNGTYALYGVK